MARIAMSESAKMVSPIWALLNDPTTDEKPEKAPAEEDDAEDERQRRGGSLLIRD